MMVLVSEPISITSPALTMMRLWPLHRFQIERILAPSRRVDNALRRRAWPQGIAILSPWSMKGADGDFLRQRRRAAGMIVVIMGDQHIIDFLDTELPRRRHDAVGGFFEPVR